MRGPAEKKVGALQSWSKEGIVRHSEQGSQHTIEKQGNKLPGERNNARNNVSCTQARKTTHGLDGQHQPVNRTTGEKVNQSDRGQI